MVQSPVQESLHVKACCSPGEVDRAESLLVQQAVQPGSARDQAGVGPDSIPRRLPFVKEREVLLVLVNLGAPDIHCAHERLGHRGLDDRHTRNQFMHTGGEAAVVLGIDIGWLVCNVPGSSDPSSRVTT